MPRDEDETPVEGLGPWHRDPPLYIEVTLLPGRTYKVIGTSRYGDYGVEQEVKKLKAWLAKPHFMWKKGRRHSL